VNLRGIDHLAVVVPDLDAAIALCEGVLGVSCAGRQLVEQEGVEIAFFPLGGESRLELVTPLGGESGVARFLRERGGGLHHVALRLDGLGEALRELHRQGVELAGESGPRTGADGGGVAFIHPRSFLGVLLELVEEPARPGAG
jgi:methylmalonyl-CoA/ethylmalonyl-CoA epimerase